MLLIQRACICGLLGAVGAGCGDDTAQGMTDTAGTSTTTDTSTGDAPEAPSWLLGSWSSESPGFDFNTCNNEHLQFHADGRALQGGVICDAKAPSFDKEFTWELTGTDTVIVHLPDGEYAEAWQVTRGKDPLTAETDCAYLEVVDVIAGLVDENTRRGYIRGEVCFETLPMCDDGIGNCDAYRSMWCEAAPPACESS